MSQSPWAVIRSLCSIKLILKSCLILMSLRKYSRQVIQSFRFFFPSGALERWPMPISAITIIIERLSNSSSDWVRITQWVILKLEHFIRFVDCLQNFHIWMIYLFHNNSIRLYCCEFAIVKRWHLLGKEILQWSFACSVHIWYDAMHSLNIAML